jgi:hypothetical protein
MKFHPIEPLDLFSQKTQKKVGHLITKAMTEKANKTRAIGVVIGIVVLVIALLWKRLSR